MTLNDPSSELVFSLPAVAFLSGLLTKLVQPAAPDYFFTLLTISIMELATVAAFCWGFFRPGAIVMLVSGAATLVPPFSAPLPTILTFVLLACLLFGLIC